MLRLVLKQQFENMEYFLFQHLVTLAGNFAKPLLKSLAYLGSGCGTVGRVVPSNTRDCIFESRHQQFILVVNFYEKLQIIKYGRK